MCQNQEHDLSTNFYYIEHPTTSENTSDPKSREHETAQSRPPTDSDLLEVIRRHWSLQMWFQDKTFETIVPKRRDVLIFLSYIQTILDTADGIVLLIEKGMPAPALMLLRPMLEGYERLLWLRKIASSADIDNFCQTRRFPRELNLESLVKLNNVHDPETKSLTRRVLNQDWFTLNDYVHIGFSHVLNRVSDESLEPQYPIDTQINSVELATEVVANSTYEHFDLFGDACSKDELAVEVLKSGLKPLNT